MVVPNGLGVRGTEFWNAIDSAYDLAPKDVPVFTECCRLLDQLDGLAFVLAAEGTMTTGSTGQSVVHPALAQYTRHTLALERVLSVLGLPDVDGVAVPVAASLRGRSAQKAASVRWAGHVPDAG